MQKQKALNAKLTLTFIIVAAVALLAILAACAPQETGDAVSDPEPVEVVEEAKETEEDSPSNSTVDLSFSMDSDCGTCHKKAVESEQNAHTVSSVHASHEVSCITCHDQEETLKEVHDNATSMDEPKRLKTAKISEETCLSCHVSYEELATKTADVTVLTDANGLTINPHSAKQLNEEHASEITCMKCHTEHEEIDENKSQNYCMNCHHMKVYECNTCHENH